MFQPALTSYDSDVDSDLGSSIGSDDRSSCKSSDTDSDLEDGGKSKYYTAHVFVSDNFQT